MPFWLVLVLFAASIVVSGLLAPRPSGAKASGLGDFTAPTADETRTVPVIWGTVNVSGPNVTWYGDLKAKAIRVRSGLFTHTTVGYWYSLGMQLAVCHGAAEFVALRIGQAPDDRELPQRPAAVGLFGMIVGTGGYAFTEETSDYKTIRINAPNLFGGDKREGGLRGDMRIYLGTDTQPSDPYLSRQLGQTAPAYHGIVHAVLMGAYVGTSNYLKNFNFVMRRCPNNLGLAANEANINGDANPAEIIYECLTSTKWGLGIPSSRFNLANWTAVAKALAAEGMGMSMQLDSARPADEIIGDVCRHIDGVAFTDPATGLWNIKLARADYNLEDLLVLGDNDILEAPEFSRGSWEETLNDVRVVYVDRATFRQKTTTPAQDTANYATTGEPKVDKVEFLGFSNAALAQKAAMRELKTRSYPIAKVRFTAKRKAWNLRPGSAFAFTWTPDGITNLPMRVLSINYGALDEGKIEINAVEDIFAVAHSAFDPPGPSNWVDPTAEPEAPEAQLAIESPYQLLPTTAAQERVAVGAVRGDNTCQGFLVYADEGSGFYQSNSVDTFCPSGILQNLYPRTTAAVDAAGFTLTGERDLETLLGTDAVGRDRGDCLLYFADTGEICAFTSVTANSNGSFTLGGIVRGCYDTLPADHPPATRVFILYDAGTPFIADYKGDTVEVGGSGDGGGIPVGGDVNPADGTVEAIQGIPVDTTPPTDGQVMQYVAADNEIKWVTDRPMWPTSAVAGKPEPGQLVMKFVAPCAMMFPANFSTPDSVGHAGVNPQAPRIYAVYKNEVQQIGTVSIAVDGTVTFATTGGLGFSVNKRDRLTAFAPGVQDATLADVGFTLVGVRSQTLPAGQPVPVPNDRLQYDNTALYQPWDLVEHLGSTYRAIVPTIGHAPPDGAYWVCWAQRGTDGAAGGAQTGAGDLGGTNAAPIVTGIQGKPVDSTAPTEGQALVYQGTAWKPGSSIPAGGTTGQALVKKTNTDRDTEWKTVGASVATSGNLYPASRAKGVIYQNTTGKVIFLIIGEHGNGTGTASVLFGDTNPPTLQQSSISQNGGWGRPHFAIILPNQYYKLNYDTDITVDNWFEYTLG